MNENLKRRICFGTMSALACVAIALWIPQVQNLFLQLGEFLLRRGLRKPEKWIRLIK